MFHSCVLQDTSAQYFRVFEYLSPSDCREQVFCCEVCPESNLVAVGLNNGVVKILDVFEGKHFYTLVDVEVRRTYLPAVTCSWLGNERLVVGYASGSLKVELQLQ